MHAVYRCVYRGNDDIVAPFSRNGDDGVIIIFIIGNVVGKRRAVFYKLRDGYEGRYLRKRGGRLFRSEMRFADPASAFIPVTMGRSDAKAAKDTDIKTAVMTIGRKRFMRL